METFGTAELLENINIDVFEQVNLKKTRKKGPSGHVAAGRKWETSEKGRIWKAQTIKAKEELRAIIRKRTGLDVYANQRMALKYAGLIRDGKTAEAKRIVEKVIANAKQVANKESKKKTRRLQHRGQQEQRGPKENSAEFPAVTKNQIQPVQRSHEVQQPYQLPAILPNPAEKGVPQIPRSHEVQQPPVVDRVDLPDLLD